MRKVKGVRIHNENDPLAFKIQFRTITFSGYAALISVFRDLFSYLSPLFMKKTHFFTCIYTLKVSDT